tara:strand:- start:1931 stop:2620 length:690 start_codon:yes stop_codon:yes gene_type:complete
LYKKKKYLAVILARGGSKRLPRKNLRKLNGKPLIAHSILSSLKCQYLDEIIVSSDDKEILKVSQKYGAKIIKRPKYLASDKAKTFYAVKHVVENSSNFDYVVLLQPTSPFRNEKHIHDAINLLEKKNADAIVSVCKTEHNPLWSNILPKNFSMKGFLKNNILNKRSQDLKNYYRLNGAIYICKINSFLKEKSFFLQKKIYAFEMPQEDSIDIDTEFDFKMAMNYINKNK